MVAECGFDRFQSGMSEFASQYIDPAYKAKNNTGETIERPTDSAFSSAFYGFIEISNTLEALRLCEKLIGVAPPRSRAIKPDEYFKFLISAYLQEMYILEQRLSSYATKMGRLYKKTQILPIVEKMITKPLEGIVKVRGAHVHAQRYSDQELDMLSTFTLLSQFDSKYAEHLKEQYWWAQLEWGKKVKSNNVATRALVDNYFDIIFLVMTKDGQFFLPRTGRSAKSR